MSGRSNVTGMFGRRGQRLLFRSWFPIRCSLLAILLALARDTARAQPGDPLVLEFTQAMRDYDEATDALAANPDRARQLFRASAQRLESIRAAGVSNGRLEYNLGNAYLNAADLGRAILSYRRALLDIPRDPNLHFNLDAARRRCLTHISPTRSDRVLRSVFFWHYAASLAGRARWGLVGYIAAWAAAAAYVFQRRRGWLWLAAASFVIALAAGGSAAVEVYEMRHAPPGVVLASDVTVYKGPGAGYQRQFEQPLQAGVEFTLRERRGDWWRIAFADDREGWIPARTAELVPF